MNKERVLLHCDINNFYASVECLYNPSIREKPVAVGGDVEAGQFVYLTMFLKQMPRRKLQVIHNEINLK